MMDRYKCNECNITFRNYNHGYNNDSQSEVVRRLTARCPACGSFDIGLTEHGKLLVERQKKIQKLNEISK